MAKTNNTVVTKVNSIFGSRIFLSVVLEVALTNTLSSATRSSLGEEGLSQMTEDYDLICKYTMYKDKWGLRPNGRKLLSQALNLLTDAASKTLTSR